MSDSNRLEREIEEILGKIEQFPDATSRRRRSRNRTLQRLGTAISDRQRALMRWLSRFTMSQVMLTSFILILASLFFRRAAPGLMAWVLYAGIILFVTSFAILMFSRNSGSSSQQKWRGRTVQYRATPGITDRLRQWWRMRTRR